MVRRKTVVRGEKPEWFDESSTLGHLEMMIKGSEVLGSAEEYQFWVIEYARYLGKEDFDGRLEELLKDLLGSAHSSPIVDKGGIVKRVLAVLGELARAHLCLGIADGLNRFIRIYVFSR